MINTNCRVRLYFIRHAQSEANLVFETICGQNISSVLSPLGNEQSILLGKRLKYQNIKFDYLFCSTAMRAKQTAEIVLKIMNVDASKLVTSSALLEQSQGHWEGMNRNYVIQQILCNKWMNYILNLVLHKVNHYKWYKNVLSKF